jgi:hypothetical protein
MNGRGPEPQQTKEFGCGIIGLQCVDPPFDPNFGIAKIRSRG